MIHGEDTRSVRVNHEDEDCSSLNRAGQIPMVIYSSYIICCRYQLSPES